VDSDRLAHTRLARVGGEPPRRRTVPPHRGPTTWRSGSTTAAYSPPPPPSSAPWPRVRGIGTKQGTCCGRRWTRASRSTAFATSPHVCPGTPCWPSKKATPSRRRPWPEPKRAWPAGPVCDHGRLSGGMERQWLPTSAPSWALPSTNCLPAEAISTSAKRSPSRAVPRQQREAQVWRTWHNATAGDDIGRAMGDKTWSGLWCERRQTPQQPGLPRTRPASARAAYVRLGWRRTRRGRSGYRRPVAVVARAHLARCWTYRTCLAPLHEPPTAPTLRGALAWGTRRPLEVRQRQARHLSCAPAALRPFSPSVRPGYGSRQDRLRGRSARTPHHEARAGL
jgi:hypothetical protein